MPFFAVSICARTTCAKPPEYILSRILDVFEAVELGSVQKDTSLTVFDDINTILDSASKTDKVGATPYAKTGRAVDKSVDFWKPKFKKYQKCAKQLKVHAPALQSHLKCAAQVVADGSLFP